MATNFRVKSGRLTFVRRLGIPKQVRISHFRFQKFDGDDMATSCKNLVNFDLVISEFKRFKCVTYISYLSEFAIKILSHLCI